MQVIHGPTGMPFEFPDNTPEPEIQNFFRQAETQMPTPERPVAQQFAQGIQDFQQQQALTPQQPPINGRGFVGMTPQQAQFHLQQRQNQRALEQRGAIEQQRLRADEQRLNQQSIENEKDRSFRIKEFQSRLKNQQDIAKAKAEVDKLKEKANLLNEKDRREFEIQALQMEHDAEMLQDQNKRYNVGGTLVDSAGNVVFQGSQGGQEIPWERAKILMNDEQGNPVPVEAWVAPGQKPQVIGPAVQGGRGGGGAGGGTVADLDPATDRARMGKITDRTFEIAEEVSTNRPGPKNITQEDLKTAKQIAAPEINKTYGVAPFENKQQRKEALKAKTKQRFDARKAEIPEGAHPRVEEQNRQLAVYEAKAWVLQQYGIPAEVTPEGVRVPPEYKEQVEELGKL